MKKSWFITFGLCILLALSVVASSCGTSTTSTPRSQSFGPTSFNIGTGYSNFTIPSINTGDRVEFNFSSAGALVYYIVFDPNNNSILNGNGGNKVASGGGSFTASGAGRYVVQFNSSGIITPSVITVSYTVYYAH